MGARSSVQKSLESPRAESELAEALVGVPDCDEKTWITGLLDDAIPTNFNYEDICRRVDHLTSDTFIVLPIWTLGINKIDSAAMCILNYWPRWTSEQRGDVSFLQNVRVICPIFEPGKPIGHARFMFLDNWDPVSVETFNDELDEWSAVVVEYIPVPGIVSTILVDYGGLCGSIHQRPLPLSNIKVLDSLLGKSTRCFEAESLAFQKVLQRIHDPSWIPPEKKYQGSELADRLASVRAYLTAIDVDRLMDTILLPSTLQTGLECIIITLCRVMATWLTPLVIPFQDCTVLCQEKKGRRILSELLLLSHSCRVSPEAATVIYPVPIPDSCPTVLDIDIDSGDDSPPSGWYTVYEKPTFRIMTRDPEFQQRPIEFKGQLAYEIYTGCRYVHTQRSQDFLPEESLLSMNGKLGSMYICPVKNVIERSWHFILLGQPGYQMFAAGGRTIGTRRFHFQNVDKAELASSDSKNYWTPPVPSDDGLQSFLTTLADPTWNLPKKPGASDHDGQKVKAGRHGVDHDTKHVSPRRSGRKRRPPKKLNIGRQTSRKKVTVPDMDVMFINQ